MCGGPKREWEESIKMRLVVKAKAEEVSGEKVVL